MYYNINKELTPSSLAQLLIRAQNGDFQLFIEVKREDQAGFSALICYPDLLEDFPGNTYASYFRG